MIVPVFSDSPTTPPLPEVCRACIPGRKPCLPVHFRFEVHGWAFTQETPTPCKPPETFIGVFVELSACVQDGHDHPEPIFSTFVHIRWDAAPSSFTEMELSG